MPVMCIPGNPNDLESFLEPLYQELETLNDGIQCRLWNGQTTAIRCHLLHEIADLPAKKKPCRVKAVNGYCLCLYCSISVHKSGPRGHVYCPDHSIVTRRARSEALKSSKKVLWCPEQLLLRTVEPLGTAAPLSTYPNLKQSATSG